MYFVHRDTMHIHGGNTIGNFLLRQNNLVIRDSTKRADAVVVIRRDSSYSK